MYEVRSHDKTVIFNSSILSSSCQVADSVNFTVIKKKDWQVETDPKHNIKAGIQKQAKGQLTATQRMGL